MKSIWLGLAGVAACTASAAADDVSSRYHSKAAVSEATYNWSGFYAGVHAGYGVGVTEWTPMDIRGDGGFGGVQAGYNQQIGNLVLGVEADIGFGKISGERNLSALGQLTLAQRSSIDWLSTVTGRVGFANGRWMTYAKAGAAWSSQQYGEDLNRTAAPVTTLSGSGRDNRNGWVVGAGVEYALAGNWSVRGEYDFVNFPESTFVVAGTVNPGGAFTGSGTTTQALHLVKLAVNYQFGAPKEAKPIAPLRYAAAGFDWTGLYLGAQAGYGGGKVDWLDNDGAVYHTRGGFAGGQVGANVQLGVVLLGVEAELVGGNLGGGVQLVGGPTTVDFNTRTEWLGMATARVGMITAERWLTYVKAGVAAAEHRQSIYTSQGPLFADLAGPRLDTGVVLGAGVEYALAPNWSVKAEYNHIDFKRSNALIEGNVNAPPLVGQFYQAFTIKQNVELAKIGVNYHFAP